MPQDADTLKEYVQEAYNHHKSSRFLQAAFLCTATIVSLGQTFAYGEKTFIEPLLYFSLDKPRAKKIFKENKDKLIQSIYFVAFGCMTTLTSLVYPHWTYSRITICTLPPREAPALVATRAKIEPDPTLIDKNRELEKRVKHLEARVSEQAERLRTTQTVDVEARKYQETVVSDLKLEVQSYTSQIEKQDEECQRLRTHVKQLERYGTAVKQIVTAMKMRQWLGLHPFRN